MFQPQHRVVLWAVRERVNIASDKQNNRPALAFTNNRAREALALSTYQFYHLLFTIPIAYYLLPFLNYFYLISRRLLTTDLVGCIPKPLIRLQYSRLP